MKNKTTELIKFRLKRGLENNANLYIAIAKGFAFVKGDKSGRVVSKNSKVCIEGFPRCANSFSRDAFVKYTGISKNIATHLHSSAQIKKAVELSIPTIVNIRHPQNCITSLRALSVQYQGARKEPIILPLEFDLKWYINFYKSLIPLKGKFVIADFPETISNFESIMNKVNLKYENQFPKVINDSYSFSVDILKENKSKGKGHLGPNTVRDNIIKGFKEEYDNSPFNHLKEEAERIYFEFIQ